MNSHLNKIIKDNFNEFDRWIEILNRQRDSIFTVESLNEDEYTKLTYETSHLPIKTRYF